MKSITRLSVALAPALLSAISPASAAVLRDAQQPLIDSRPVNSYDHSQNYNFDPLLHMPGISPYFDAIGFGLQHAAPLGCKITAASYLVRHASIYANDDDWEAYVEPFLKKLNESKKAFTGPLEVFNSWESPYTDIENQMEQLTPSGANESYNVGKHLLKRYPDLVPTTRKIYADKKSRTQDTANAFAKAFPQDVELHEIAKDGEFHATVPHKSCKKFTKKAGSKEQAAFAAIYTNGTKARLQPHAPFNLTTNDVIGMQQLCGYESAIRGHKSKLCDIWTATEIMGYEYLWDIRYFYMVGPGNHLSPYLGFPWLNRTAKLFETLDAADRGDASEHIDPDSKIPHDNGQRFFISFTHREVPPVLATALDIFASSAKKDEVMPTSHINFPRAWRMAELIPFLGHIGMEKLSCTDESGMAGEYVRVLANSAPRPIPECQQGPGASCEFGAFLKFVQKGSKKYGDFNGVCGNKKKDHDH